MRLGFAVGLLSLAACGAEVEPQIQTPLEGVDGTRDGADRHCRVVLRSISRLPSPSGGFETNGSSWIWEGQVDVSDDARAENLVPSVIYQSGSDRTWREVTTSFTSGAPSGFQRFFFRIQEGVPGPGMSGTSLSRARVRLIPFLRFAEGGRLFDHNRVADLLASYELTARNNFAIAGDAAICPGRTMPEWDPAELRFTEDFRIEQSAPLVAGERAIVFYDLDRLPSCRGTHNGFRFWNITAFFRFFPGGEQVEGQIEGGPLHVVIPNGAERVEVWFHNGTGDNSCSAWDSNDSRNYHFPILQRPSWIGNARVKISRAGGEPCATTGDMVSGFNYDTWSRQRSIMGNVCFEVWREGLTDQNDREVWRRLDARIYYRWDASQPFRWGHVGFLDRIGNNARFVTDVAGRDQFHTGQCPDAPTSMVDGYEEARFEFYFAVNGVFLGAPDDQPFVGRYVDYPSAFRDASCAPR